ncbi:tetratricopeptide repeat protein [Pontixanthobacter gangjinensis]|nr:tetratricopeptide repeat protein [Pontixanthobacter gangjinensis]
MLGLAACSDTDPELAPIERAQHSLAAGDGIAAEVILREMIVAGVRPQDVAAYLGEAELRQGQTAEARQWLGEGNFSKQTRGHGFHMLGRLEMEEGNLPEAGRAFDKALADKPEDAELWVDIGRLRYRGGEQMQAVEASIKAVEFDELNPTALQFRAQLVRDSQGMQAALSWFEQALERNPENTGLLYEYAATLGEMGRAREMLVNIRKIAKINPANRKIYYLQAVLAARAGKFELARLLLLRADKATLDLPAAMLLSGIIDVENGNYASAAQTLEALAAKQPENRRVQQVLARALALGGNDDEVIYLYADAANLPGASPYLKSLVARSYEALDQRDKAGPLLDQAARLRSDNLVAVEGVSALEAAEARGSESGKDALDLIRARIVSGNAQGAVAAAANFAGQFPGSFDALSLAGDANLAARRYNAAIENYDKAATIRQTWTLTRKMIKAYHGAKQSDAALELLARYFVGDQANVEAATLLAREALKRDDLDAAAIFADHALTNGGARDFALLSLRSKIAFLMKEFDFGLALAEEAYRLQPMSHLATAQLAAAYRKVEGGKLHAAQLGTKAKRLKR